MAQRGRIEQENRMRLEREWDELVRLGIFAKDARIALG